jgi:hypothetical protein
MRESRALLIALGRKDVEENGSDLECGNEDECGKLEERI